MPDLSIRMGQTITPFGVGSIFTADGESFTAVDISVWDRTKGKGRKLECDRLAKYLKVQALFEPRSEPSFSYGQNRSGSLPYYRFPRWLFCGRCRALVKWTVPMEKQLNGKKPSCSKCHSRLYPMRFIQVCSKGHMSDIDWRYWCHSRPGNDPEKRQCAANDIRYVTIPNTGGGLASLEIRCGSAVCSARRNLSGLTSVDSLKQIGMKCTGTQPWENMEVACDQIPQVVGSTAANVYFPKVESALDIPPYSNFSRFGGISSLIRLDDRFEVVKNNYADSDGGGNPLLPGLIASIADKVGCEVQDVRRTIEEDLHGEVGGQDNDFEDILGSEWHALRVVDNNEDLRDRFVTTHFYAKEFLTDSSFCEFLLDIVQVHKLREVRSLVGFNRYERTNDTDKFVPSGLSDNMNWLPAIEVYGEGLFLSLDEEKLRIWENESGIAKRYGVLNDRLDMSRWSDWIPKASPRFVLLHTLAHLLMRELCYDCGYSSAALRERIYSSGLDEPGTHMAGILIYTASGDSEGTMGGLVRQGTPYNIGRIIKNALDRAVWCSNDPVCQEIVGQGTYSLNLAACHACSLVPETSCIYGNSVLDRRSIVGLGSFFTLD